MSHELKHRIERLEKEVANLKTCEGNPRRKRRRNGRKQKTINYGGRKLYRIQLINIVGKEKARKIWHAKFGGPKKLK